MFNESHSTFVNTSHEVYFHDGSALHKDQGQDKFTLSDMNSYLGTYGVNPYDSIEGYLIDKESLTSIEKVESTDNYSFILGLNPEKATTNVRIQMKQFGGLDDYPSFSQIQLTLNLQDDFTPVSISLDSQYKAKKGMDSDCHQEYTVTFSDFNQKIDIPNLASIIEEYGF